MKVAVTTYIKNLNNGLFVTATRTINIYPAKKPGTSGFWLYDEDTDSWFNTQTQLCDELIELYVHFVYQRYLAPFEKLIKIISIKIIQQ